MAKKSTKVANFRRGKVKRARGRGKMYDARAIEVIERRFKAIDLRTNGFSIRQIAQELNVSDVLVRQDLKTVLNDTLIASAETAEENRQLQVERLDALLRSMMPYALENHKEERLDMRTMQMVVIDVPPDPKFVNTVLNIEARRAKLLALDIPETKHLDVSGIRLYEGVDVSKV